MCLRECADSHDRAGHRDAGLCDKPAQRIAGVGADDAAAHVEHRPLALLNQPDNLVELKFARLPILGVESGDVDLGREEDLRTGLLDVFRYIDDHRAGPTAGGYLERLFHHDRDFVDIGDEVAVFHHRQGHPVKVSLLESTLADHRLRHLTGDGDQRDRIHVRVGNASDEVGGAGAAGGHADACLAVGTSVALSRKRTTLLVSRQDGANLFRTGQRLVQLHARSARVGEQGVHTLPLQGFDENLTAEHARPNLALGLG